MESFLGGTEMNVLLLTNCVAAEQPFVQQLVTLGHEVLCSNQLLKQLNQKQRVSEISNYFEGVIFSENVSNKEVEDTWQVLSHIFSYFYRRSDNEASFSHADKKETIDGEVTVIPIPLTASLETLRETILPPTANYPLKNKRLAEEGLKEINFSRLEQNMMDLLMAHFGETVGRDMICEVLWDKRAEESMKSQLSSMTKKIKQKIGKSSVPELRLHTVWGRGYCLKFS